MKTYSGNITTKRYPRATWDNCTRHPSPMSGPHRPAGRFYARTLAVIVAVAALAGATLVVSEWVADLKTTVTMHRSPR